MQTGVENMKQTNGEYLYNIMRGYNNNTKETAEFTKRFDKKACSYLDKFNNTLLQNAISSEKYDIAKFLIEKECNLDHQDDRGHTALDYLLGGYNDSESKLYDELLDGLLKKDIDLSLENKYGNQALWTAVKNAKIPLKIIEKLLKKGAEPHHKNASDTSPYDMVQIYNIKELSNLFKPYRKDSK